MSRQDLERLGHKVRGTYRGPLGWHECMALYDDLQQARLPDGTHTFTLGSLHIVSQDDGYNIVIMERNQDKESEPNDQT